MMFNPMQLPNVSVDKKIFSDRLDPALIPTVTYEYRLKELRELLWMLATDKPTWQFKVVSAQLSTASNTLTIRTIRIEEDGALLGTFSADYHGSNYKLFVENDRIAKERTHRNAGKMVTSDVKRAKREILKTFYKKNPIEMAEAAMEKLRASLRDMQYEARSKLRHLSQTFFNDAAEFAQAHMEFIAQHESAKHLVETKAKIVDGTAVKDSLDAFDTLAIGVTESMTGRSEYAHAAMVVSLGSTYIVTYKGSTEVIPSEELADMFRTNLGLLKLVDVNTAYDGVGLRASSDVFLVIPTISENENVN